jgi:hypothetical protein
LWLLNIFLAALNESGPLTRIIASEEFTGGEAGAQIVSSKFNF